MLVEPGQRLGDLVVDERIGAGGMAQVWAVHDPETGERFALKVQRSATERARLRMSREARTQGRLEHPNLLPALRTFVDGDQVAILLPLIHGPSLDVIVAEGALARDEVLAIVLAIARGLACAHRFGLVHRDVKPANVLLDLQPGGVVPRVSDFGLVKSDDPILTTMQGTPLGTPAYAAPEQLLDATHVDARADLWSLGVVLVELATGLPPGRGRELLAARDPDLAAMADELLQPDPGRRTASAGQLVVRLEALLPEDADPLGATSRLAGHVAAHTAAAPTPVAPSPATWREEPAAPATAPQRLTVADFLTRHADSMLREQTNRLHFGRLALALAAAVGAAVLGARCAG